MEIFSQGAEQAVDVRLGTAPADTLGVLRDALERGVQVELAYYSSGRAELSERRVEPAKVFSDQGNWYLSGWCHRAEGERVFRLDRIRTAALNSGRVRVIAADARDSLEREYEYQEGGAVRPDQQRGPGGQESADFMLRGYMSDIVNRGGNKKYTYYKITMELADHLMGVTMQEPGVSRLVTVDVDEAAELAAS